MVSVAKDKPQGAFQATALLLTGVEGMGGGKKEKSFSFAYVGTQCRFKEGPQV